MVVSAVFLVYSRTPTRGQRCNRGSPWTRAKPRLHLESGLHESSPPACFSKPNYQPGTSATKQLRAAMVRLLAPSDRSMIKLTSPFVPHGVPVATAVNPPNGPEQSPPHGQP